MINLKKYAITYLSKYSTSKKNLFTILKRKVNKENIDKNNKLKLYAEISKIINDLENINIINDGEYAENKIILFSSQGKSKYFIINYLKQKGIDNHLIVKTFETYEINNPYWEKESAKIFAKKRGLGSNKLINKEKD